MHAALLMIGTRGSGAVRKFLPTASQRISCALPVPGGSHSPDCDALAEPANKLQKSIPLRLASTTRRRTTPCNTRADRDDEVAAAASAPACDERSFSDPRPKSRRAHDQSRCATLRQFTDLE